MFKRVYIVGGDLSYSSMFLNQGWIVTNDLLEAQLVQFTGGSDVTPAFYNELKHPKTTSNLLRDKREKLIFNLCLKHNIAMAGICRGGQFLNVMNGGRMWQHVNNHAGVGTHKIVDMLTGLSFTATSTHHQMMIPTKNAKILGVAKESTSKERIGKSGQILTLVGQKGQDAEVLFYSKSNSLCFQPHPEMAGFENLRDTYFKYISVYLNV